MKIHNLQNALIHFNAIAEHHHNEWSHFKDEESLKDRKIRMQKYLKNDFMPTMYVGTINSKPVGTVAIVENDLEIRKKLTPWLASVYIFPEFRKHGYSIPLIQHLIDKCKINNYQEIFLYTENAAGLYKKLGWETVEKTLYKGSCIYIMKKYL